MGVWGRIKAFFAPEKAQETTRTGRKKPMYPKFRLGPPADPRAAAWDAASLERFKYIPDGHVGATPPEHTMRTMRNRFRYMARNDAIMASDIKTYVTNVVTHSLSPQSQTREDGKFLPPVFKGAKIRANWAERFRDQSEAAWRMFSRGVDPTGTMSMVEFASQMAERLRVDGEVLVHKVVSADPSRIIRTSFELLDVDRIRTPSDKAQDSNVRHGVRYNNGAVVGYYLLRENRAWDSAYWDTSHFDFIPTERGKLIFRRRFPGQVRGISDWHAAVQTGKDMTDLLDATILKMQKSASITSVAWTNDPGSLESAWDEGDDETSGVNTYASVPVKFGETLIIPQIDNIKEFDTNTPAGTFEPFITSRKGDLATAMGYSGLTLTKDGRKVNYSSMRGLYLGDRMYFQGERNILRRGWDWMWEGVCDEGVLVGLIEAPFYSERKADYLRVMWHFGPWGWVDPKKEIDANQGAIDYDILSLREVAQTSGGDAEQNILDNLRLKKFKQDMAKEMGVDLSPIEKKKDAPAGGDGEEDEDEGEQENMEPNDE